MHHRFWIVIAVLVGCGQPELSHRVTALVDPPAEIDFVPTTLGPAPRAQRAGPVAATGAGYMVFWSDAREGFGTLGETERPWFARLTADGTVLDPTGIPILGAQAASGLFAFIAACDDSEHCVIVGALNDPQHSLVALRIAGDTVLDATPRLVAEGGTHGLHISSIAWDGAGFRVTWAEDGVGVKTATVQLDGTASAPILVSNGAFSWVACQRPQCVLVYSANPTGPPALRSRTIDATGVLGPETELLPDHTGFFGGGLTWDGARYWLALAQADRIGFRRLAADGSVIDASLVVVATGSDQSGPTLVHDGTQTVALWSVTRPFPLPRETRVARIDDTGTVLDPGGVVFGPGAAIFPACRTDGCLALVFASRVFGRPGAVRFTGTTPVGGEFLFATAPPSTADAAVIFAHDRYLAIWSDSRDSSSTPGLATLRGATFSTDLVPTQTIELPPRVPPPANARCNEQHQVSVAASATSYLVTWFEQCSTVNAVFAQMLDASGQPTGAAFTVREKAQRPATHPGVASDGTGFLVVWDDLNAAVAIRAQRYDASGALLGPPFSVTNGGFIPVIAFDGASYLVVWRRIVAGKRHVFSQRVSPTGELVGGEVVIANGPSDEEGQSVACGGGLCGVAWRGADVRFSRIAPDGSLLDPGGIVLATGLPPVLSAAYATSVTWDGAAFVVLWQSGNEYGLARVSPSGEVLPASVPTIAPVTPPQEATLVSNGAGQTIAFYDRFDSTPAFRVRRVRAIPMSDSEPPPVDAGVPDAAPDAAAPTPDAAAPTPDAAAPTPDAAVPPSPPHTGCSVAANPSLLGWLAGASLVLTARRRRTTRCRRT